MVEDCIFIFLTGQNLHATEQEKDVPEALLSYVGLQWCVLNASIEVNIHSFALSHSRYNSQL